MKKSIFIWPPDYDEESKGTESMVAAISGMGIYFGNYLQSIVLSIYSAESKIN